MIRTIVWLLACAGFGVVLWLLTSAPDISSGYPRSQCYSVLGTQWGPSHGSLENGVEATCSAFQTRRVGWAVLVSIPTVVLAGAGMRRRNP
ncbi:hypothetical protein ACTWQF_08615 [Streptomyces sp. 8N114]|uniref:hypothetical protein n=1 Tax=Streptomyces sp. 8N114 TaxID=3457419 RepID=UPI003FD33A54